MTERRQSARHATAWVYYVGEGNENGGRFPVVNASEDGLYLAMEDRPELGSSLIIGVVIESRTLLLVGDVVRHVQAPPAPMPGGVGLKLTTKPKGWGALVESLQFEDSQPMLGKQKP